ncbi:MAG: aldo/keto reductase [Clostridia bacterium]|nr:aldo/keto reductase [Clostridia bacterium]
MEFSTSIKTKKLGFGLMRLPTKAGRIDHKELCRMVDAFMDAGFNYFDTAHPYMALRSEGATRKALVKRYPRESFYLVNKLTSNFILNEKQVRPFFNSQLKACGTDYFDVYLVHSVNRDNYEKFKKVKAFETCSELKKEGKIKHFGISFHDRADVLDKILSEHPEIEIVQLQFNYLDFDDPSVEGEKCYNTARKYGKDIVVMEPVKGGSLASPPDEAKKFFDELGNASYASYAIRYAAGFEGILTVLSGMGNMAMMEDNISYMRDFVPLNEKEAEAVEKARLAFRGLNLIQCTACRYCLDVCPKNIPIPDYFACLNSKKQFKGWNPEMYYKRVAAGNPAPDDCIGCGKCEKACPQHLDIRKLLKEVDKSF